MISISGLSKKFRTGDHAVAALQAIDLEVGRGEFFVLLGPSGSGKTTLLRSVAGLEKPDEGEISLNGKIGLFSQSGASLRRAGGATRSAWYFNPMRSGRI